MKPVRKSRSIPIVLPLLALGALMSAATARAEDVAIVTGIGEYGNLPNASLPGIDNDVNAMAGALGGGFRIIRLWNGQATEAGIRNAFAQAARSVRDGDRFVYYQSSHGTEDHHLLAYDTTTSGEHTLSAADIKSLMGSVHTTRKSLIMDACFSGGIKGRGSERVKFYPIRRFKSKDFARNTLRDRTDQVVRQYAADVTGTSSATADSAFVIFASSQENEYSAVVRIDGQPCSVFTHFFTESLNAANGNKGRRIEHVAAGKAARRAVRVTGQVGKGAPKAGGPVWNAVVQPTVRQTVDFTQGKQTPVFNPRYLADLVFTTSDESGGPATTSVSTLGQVYDIANIDPDTLALSATMGSDADSYGRFRPGTKVNLELAINHTGYVFLINRDDEDNAQMVSLTKNDLDFSSPDKMLEESLVEGQKTVNLSSLYKITTSPREGDERWKAFLFTNKDQARDFAQSWSELARDKNKRVHLGSVKGKKLANIERLGLQGGDSSLVTSELHYRVTGQAGN